VNVYELALHPVVKSPDLQISSTSALSTWTSDMAQSCLKAAVLVVSTTAAKDPSTDAADATLRSVFEQDGEGKWEVVESSIVSDDVIQVQRQIMQWANSSEVNLVVTTGGTGFAIGDNTPEAVAALIHKPAPGLVHAMLAASLRVTPCQCLSLAYA
jgi:gephyrin